MHGFGLETLALGPKRAFVSSTHQGTRKPSECVATPAHVILIGTTRNIYATHRIRVDYIVLEQDHHVPIHAWHRDLSHGQSSEADYKLRGNGCTIICRHLKITVSVALLSVNTRLMIFSSS
jgi:hypothetical protein